MAESQKIVGTDAITAVIGLYSRSLMRSTKKARFHSKNIAMRF
jgi:hypothetical protein